MKTIKPIILILILIVLDQFANAQIVYSNLQPNVHLRCNSDCASTNLFDLNNDGAHDFNITAANFYTGGTCNHRSSWVYITGSQIENSVAVSGASASALSASSPIDSGLAWSGGATLIENISQCPSPGCCIDSQGGNWGSAADKYLGLRMTINGDNYYGWVHLKLSVNNSHASCTIIDYAYEGTPNHSILAGATSGARLTQGSSVIENDLSISIFPNPISNTLIVSFSLSEPQKISLRIIDVNGRLVSTLSDKVIESGEQKIEWNTESVNAGIYFLQFQSAELTQTEKLVVTK